MAGRSSDKMHLHSICGYDCLSELHNTVWPGGVRIRRTCVASVDMTVHRSCGGAAQVGVARVVGEKVRYQTGSYSESNRYASMVYRYGPALLPIWVSYPVSITV